MNEGLNQAGLAAKVGVSIRSIKRLENGEGGPDTVRRVKEYFGLTTREVMEGVIAERIVDEVNGWRVVGEASPWQSSANGLRWQICKVRSQNAPEHFGRAKIYDISSHWQSGSDFDTFISRHARACSKIGVHPNVAMHLTSFPDPRDRSRRWFIDRWIEGDSLEQVVQSTKLELAPALKLMTDIASGLASLHAAKVICRDLKPRSVIVNQGRGVLTDFELAKLEGIQGTVRPSLWPTNVYIAPEVTNREPPRACDIYSWGMILAFIAGRREPKGRTDALQTLQASRLPASIISLSVRSLEPISENRPGLEEILSTLGKVAR